MKIFRFKEAGIGYYLHKLCHIKSKQLLISMGGYTTTSRSSRSTDHIYIYDIRNKQWHRSPISMPRRMYSFGFILSPDNKYVVIFGGNSTNHIHIFDLMKQKMVRLDSMFCPMNGGFNAVLLGDYSKDKKIVSGFIKRCWKLTDFQTVRPISNDLMGLIQRWYSNEQVHLMHITKKEHWQIGLAEVINAYESMKEFKCTRY